MTVDDLMRRYDQDKQLHVRRVASLANQLMTDAYGQSLLEGDDYMCLLNTALLHDIYEDTNTSYGEVLNAAGERTELAVIWLSRYEHETYEAYINSLCENAEPLALVVKMADIIDHLSPANTQFLKDKPSKRVRYQRAFNKITEKISENPPSYSNGRE